MTLKRILLTVSSVLAQLLVLAASCTAQELIETPYQQILAASPEALAEGYLAARYKALVGQYVSQHRDVSAYIKLGGPELMIDGSNVDQYLPILARQLGYYEEAIRKRGYRKLSSAYVATVSGACQQFDLQSGPILLDVTEFRLVLWQNGIPYEGVIVGSAVAFEHKKTPEIRLIGQASDGQINLNVRLYGFLAKNTPPDCRWKLQEATRLDRDFAAAFVARAICVVQSHADCDRGLADLDEAIRLDPRFAMAYAIRSEIFLYAPDAEHRDGKRAFEDATRACELSEWKQWQCFPPLAAAYAERGDFVNAVKWVNRALASAPPSARDELLRALESYRQKRLWRPDSAASEETKGKATVVTDSFSWEPTPGVRLDLVEQPVEPSANKRFQVKVTGTRDSNEFELWVESLSSGPVRAMPEVLFTADENGFLTGRDGEQSFLVEIECRFILPGEPLRCWIISSDGQIRARTSATPIPLVSRDPSTGYELTAELLDPAGVYGVLLNGFAPTELIHMSLSQNELEVDIGTRVFSDVAGRLFVIDPRISGADVGVAKFSAVGEKGRISIDLPWRNTPKKLEDRTARGESGSDVP